MTIVTYVLLLLPRKIPLVFLVVLPNWVYPPLSNGCVMRQINVELVSTMFGPGNLKCYHPKVITNEYVSALVSTRCGTGN
jgi:hypothetical protein